MVVQTLERYYSPSELLGIDMIEYSCNCGREVAKDAGTWFTVRAVDRDQRSGLDYTAELFSIDIVHCSTNQLRAKAFLPPRAPEILARQQREQ